MATENTTKSENGTFGLWHQLRSNWLAILLALFWLFPVAGAIQWITSENKSNQQAEAELERLASLELPIDNETLHEWYKNRTNTDSTAAWEEIFFVTRFGGRIDTGDMPSIGDGELPASLVPNSEWSDEQQVGQYLATMRPLITKIHSATKDATPTYLPINFDGFETLLVPYDSVRPVSRLLKLELEHAVHQDDHERASQALRSLGDFPKVVDWPLAIVGELVHSALVASHYSAIQRTLASDFWSESEIDDLIKSIDTPRELSEKWRAAFAVERAFALASFDSDSQFFGFGEYDNATSLLLSPNAYLKGASEWEAMSDDGIQKLLQRARSFTETTDSAHENLAVALMAPSVDSLAQTFERSETLRRLTITALGIKKFHLNKDKWPTSLSELESVGMAKTSYTTVEGVPFHIEPSEMGLSVSTFKRSANESSSDVREWRSVEVGNLEIDD